MYKCVVFDVDGTLINTETAILKTFQELLRTEKRKDYKLEELKFTMGITGSDAFEQLGFQNIDDTVIKFNKILVNYLDLLQPFLGVKKLLQDLREKNVLLGVVTSRKHSEMEVDFAQNWYSHIFEAIICADDTKYHKPHPEPLEVFFKSTGIQKEESIYIGDTIYDYECAKKAGVDFALATWGSEKLDIAEEYIKLKEPSDLLKYIID